MTGRPSPEKERGIYWGRGANYSEYSILTFLCKFGSHLKVTLSDHDAQDFLVIIRIFLIRIKGSKT